MKDSDMKMVCCEEGYAGEILGIFNEAIVNSTSLYDYKPRTMEMMAGWFEVKRKGNFPVIGMVGEQDDGEGEGKLLGFGSYGAFRAFPAYKYTVEHSVYVEKGHRGRGIGRRILQELIAAARGQEYHVLVGVIDARNAASIGLHEALGFSHAGTVRQVGYKFGRWLDVAMYQMILETPGEPREG